MAAEGRTTAQLRDDLRKEAESCRLGGAENPNFTTGLRTSYGRYAQLFADAALLADRMTVLEAENAEVAQLRFRLHTLESEWSKFVNGGELVCEQHPELDWPHGDCAGPGCPKSIQVDALVFQRDQLVGDKACLLAAVDALNEQISARRLADTDPDGMPALEEVLYAERDMWRKKSNALEAALAALTAERDRLREAQGVELTRWLTLDDLHALIGLVCSERNRWENSGDKRTHLHWLLHWRDIAVKLQAAELAIELLTRRTEARHERSLSF